MKRKVLVVKDPYGMPTVGLATLLRNMGYEVTELETTVPEMDLRSSKILEELVKTIASEKAEEK